MSLAEMEPLLEFNSVRFARAGDARAQLLSGPRGPQAESYVSHLTRFDSFDVNQHSAMQLRALIRHSGIVGRGGGEFPLSRKVDRAVLSTGDPLIIVNASESEPASRKDATLLSRRPHIVLDGAEIVAASVGGSQVIVYLHEGDITHRVQRAIRERQLHSKVKFQLVAAPNRYVAGEASAVVSFLSSGVAVPQHRTATSNSFDVDGRPTVLSNTETFAHVALVAHRGLESYRSTGSVAVPGPTLITLVGDVVERGLVLEILSPVSLQEVLRTEGGLDSAPRAILVGGYAGTWIPGDSAWNATLDRHWFRRAGVSLGCGLIGVLGRQRCGLAETARLLGWMAQQSAGQCGPCINGLPAIASLASDLAAGTASRRDVTRLRQLGVAVRGRGACGHPTGAAMLLESALDVFSAEIREHVKGRSCLALGAGLPLSSSRLAA